MSLSAPDGLSAEAAEVWRDVAADAESHGLLDAIDRELLRSWCSTVAELRAAEAWVSEHGTTLTLRDDKGNVRSVVQAPKFVQVRGLRADLVKLASQLGFSPRGRAGLGGERTGGARGGSVVDDLAARRAARRTGTEDS